MTDLRRREGERFSILDPLMEFKDKYDPDTCFGRTETSVLE